MDENLNLAIIIGSIREGRLGAAIGEWFADRAKADGRFQVDLIDLRESGLPDRLVETEEQIPACVTDLGERLRAADAYVMVTPEYNHSYPASLKNAIDWYFDEWQAKPVGFVSYGGISAGLRAVEALRLVMPELHATTVRDVVCFPNVWEHMDESGALAQNERSDEAASKLLSQVEWWAAALKRQREAALYAA
ncbi:NADPH-dependent FMN reductase [Glycomyces salinus]|uniref:NADPH-dependent FMN reductase n=1 Tax=Glycomyces salinus TaxID=980294 RepID=UPI0018EDB54C|nr:NAD(P)H-dependent oxidoreductase [Glycomyces salinus]